MRPCFTSGLLSASLLLTATVLTPAAAQSFNQAIVFGDSNVATGWVGIGYLVNSQILASFFGLTANSANQPGGTNYAIGGALDAAVPANGNRGNLGNPSLPSTVQQITNYLASTAGVANPNAIYLVSSGSNDSAFAVGAFGTLTAQQNYLSSQATNLITAIKTLQSAGAQYIIVQNGLVSRPLANFYNQTLWTNLAAAGVAFIPADRLAMVKAVQSNPTMFGFTAATVVQATIGSGTSNTASACIYNGPGFATMGSWSQICLNSATPSTSFAYLRTANAQQTSFFADDAHLSAAGQKIEADYMYNLVTAPSEISYLAEAPVKTRAAVVAAIDSQIAISQSQSAAYHGWVSGDVSWLKMTNLYPGFPDDPGTPVAATTGFDFRLSPNWLVGFAFSGGSTKQSFSLGGDYALTEYAVSGYAAYLNGPFWGNVIASAGGLAFYTNRQVPIGISVQSNTSNTKGSNMSLMLETGHNFKTSLGIGAPNSAVPVKTAAPATPLYVTHGPVVGITLQQIRVKGFTETDQFSAIGGFTALSFLGQTRNSAVSELGYQASISLGIWRPFAKLIWNHELANTSRDVTAFLTTSTFAPGFSMPAVVFGKDWGTATIGTAMKIANNVTGYAAFNSRLAEHNVTLYGGQIGMNVALGVPADMPVEARY